MQEKILGWNLVQISELMKMVNDCGERNLLSVFDEFATKNHRHKYSVRNFYYALMNEAKFNPSVREILAKNNIQIGYTSHFCDDEERSLLRTLLVDNGRSVRAMCFALAEGDKSKAIRYQNKYRNSLKNKQDLINNLAQEIINSGQKCRVEIGGKILKIPSKIKEKNFITEDEIQSLFWGLVRLVKRSAEEELFQKQNYQMQLSNSRLNQMKIDSKKREVLLQELKKQNERLKEELNSAQKLQRESDEKYQKINSLVRDNKMSKLREFVMNLTKNEKKTSKKR